MIAFGITMMSLVAWVFGAVWAINLLGIPGEFYYLFLTGFLPFLFGLGRYFYLSKKSQRSNK